MAAVANIQSTPAGEVEVDELEDAAGDASEFLDLQDGQYYIAPPPKGEYPSREAAVEMLHQWSFEHKMNWRVQKQNKNAQGEFYKTWFCCSQGGDRRRNAPLVRPGARSQRCGCKAQIVCKAVHSGEVGGPWVIYHTRGKHDSRVHNHPPAEDPSRFASHRRRHRSDRLVQDIRSHVAAGVTTAQSLMIINGGQGNIQTFRDIENLKARERRAGTMRPAKEKKQGVVLPKPPPKARKGKKTAEAEDALEEVSQVPPELIDDSLEPVPETWEQLQGTAPQTPQAQKKSHRTGSNHGGGHSRENSGFSGIHGGSSFTGDPGSSQYPSPPQRFY